MCGIVGVASVSPVRSQDWLSVGAARLSHRGPDAHGLSWSVGDRVGLAHRRLSILELSDAGAQPMSDPWGAVTVVFNGEIYNFAELRAELARDGVTFRSHSDTEVLLASYLRWGADCVQRLRGMFAFALLDRRNETLLVARDRIGEKPLYLLHQPGELRFASELKALWADPDLPRVVDEASFGCYLAHGFVPAERSMLRGVEKLPPAHAGQFSLRDGTWRRWRYWSPPAPSPSTAGPRTLEDSATALEAVLGAAVGEQLVADVPVGVLLSGGTDSSLVAALAARTGKPVTAYTIAMPDAPAIDETAHARAVATALGMKQVVLAAEPAHVETLPDLAAQLDDPVADASILPTFLVSRLVRQHCTVVLGGDGGDELFGGYPQYQRALGATHGVARVPRVLRQLAAVGAERLLPPGSRGRDLVQWAAADFADGVPLVEAFFSATARHRLLGRPLAAMAPWPADAWAIAQLGDSATRRLMRLDLQAYLPEDVLAKVDRMSMRSSLEVRAPFLDVRVVEFATGVLPLAHGVVDGRGKVVLQALLRRYLPATFDFNRKQGFTIPLAAWLRHGPLRVLLEDCLLDGQGPFRREAVHALLRGHDGGRRNEGRLFALLAFELWRRAHRVAMP